jgi:translation initiation factor eIF-2B subunit gamma
MLHKAGITSVLLVVSDECRPHMARFVETYNGPVKISLESVSSALQSADVLRKIRGRITKDFIIVPCDLVCEDILGKLAEIHRLRGATATLLLKEEDRLVDKKGKRARPARDDEDVDFIGLAEDDRLVFKAPALDVEDTVSVQKALLRRHPRVRLTTQLQDTGLCILSHSVLAVLEENRDIASISAELIPLLVKQQFLSPPLPSPLPQRRGSTPASTTAFDVDYESLICKFNTVMGPSHSKVAKVDRRPKCYTFILPHDSGFCRPARTLAQYSLLNRDMMAEQVDKPWPSPQNFRKKDVFVMGEGCTLGEKVTCKVTVLGPGCQLGSRTKINNCIIMEGVKIGAGVIIQNSVICSNATVEEGSNLNECFVGSLTTIAAGTKAKGETFTQMG